MRKLIAAACAAILSLPAVGASGTTASAAPLPRIQVEAASDVVQVQHRHDRRDRRDRFERRRDGHYYNGHRGFRDRRAGYRQFNGYWFPPAAFVVPRVVVRPPVRAAPVRLSDRHVRWCVERYRSYRASDNTFQPNVGPRRQCASPFS
jgi:hypothetical protein